MKPGQFIKDYLTFNQKEQRGIVFLCGLWFCLFIARILIPEFIPDRPVDFSSFEKEIDMFEKRLTELDSAGKNNRSGKYLKNNYQGVFGYSDSGSKFRFKPHETLIIELNSADTFELQRLSGIGSSFARRIVKYRDRLGGFIEKSQLLEVWGMDTPRYNRISNNLIVVTDSVKRIDLNTVTFKELSFHPYFPFEITKAIMIYRKDHKRFTSLEELKSVPGIHDSTYRRIARYLKVVER